MGEAIGMIIVALADSLAEVKEQMEYRAAWLFAGDDLSRRCLY